MRILESKAELNYLKILFFLFGFLIMSWVPRLPEVKANLGLSNGEFGSLIGTSAIGAITALLTVGHLVHNYGVKLVIRIAAFAMAMTLILLTSTHSTLIFLIGNIILAGAISSFHISINTQGFDFQDRTKSSVITRLSGFWSIGALITAIVSGLLVNRIPLHIHITILSLFILLIMLFVISSMDSQLLKPNQDVEKDYKISDIFKGFRIDSLVSGALICAGFLEFAVGDWAAIFVKEDVGIKSGLHTLPYILFTFAMIIGRLRVHKLYSRFSIQFLVKLGSLVSGISFLIGILAVRLIAPDEKILILLILCISFTIAGLGSSFLAPSIMNIANSRSRAPASVVIGQLGVINNIAVFVVRLIVAWTAQAFSLSIALIIPVLLLFMVPYFSKIFKRA
jgi:fucose permease